MSGAKSRNKGRRGEAELARLLSDELGLEVTRNLLQAREGGHDLDGIPGWCLEVKRRARVTEGEKRAWWEQARAAAVEMLIRQGGAANPAVLYRADRQEWRALVGLPSVAYPKERGAVVPPYEYTADISLQAFCFLVRESLPAAA